MSGVVRSKSGVNQSSANVGSRVRVSGLYSETWNIYPYLDESEVWGLGMEQSCEVRKVCGSEQSSDSTQ